MTSTFELVAGRALSEDKDADVAIVMVEAGGTEKAFEYLAEGAPPVTEDVIGGGLEVAKTWIREIDQLHFVRTAGSKDTIEFELFVDYAGTSPSGWRRSAHRLEQANAITTKTERNSALDEATDAIVAELLGEFPDRGAGDPCGGACLDPRRSSEADRHQRGQIRRPWPVRH